MNCRQFEDLILFHAAGAAEPEETRAVLGHLGTGCPTCAGRLAEAEAMLEPLPLVLDPVSPSPAVRERLMSRVSAAGPRGSFGMDSAGGVLHPTAIRSSRDGRVDRAGAVSAAPSDSTRDRGPSHLSHEDRLPVRARPRGRSFAESWLVPAIAAGLAAAIAAVAVYLPMRLERSALEAQLANQETRIASQEARLRSLRSEFQNATTTIRMLRSPAVLVVSLAGQEQPQAAARIFWDRPRGEWRFYAANMKPAEPGKTYQLWFVTSDQQKISAGTFDVGADGEGELTVRVPDGIGAIALAAVTDEPAGGVPQPTGHFQLLGKIAGASS